MNVIELSQELTSIGVVLSKQLKMDLAFARSQIKTEDINSLSSDKVVQVIESSRTGWLFKTYNVEILKDLFQNLSNGQLSFLEDLNNSVEMHANLMQLILEMQSVIITNNNEYMWSKFMEYRNILVFYSFFFTNCKEQKKPFSEETVQHFSKLKDLVDGVLKTTATHIELTA